MSDEPTVAAPASLRLKAACLVLNAVAFYIPTVPVDNSIAFLSGWKLFAISRMPLIYYLETGAEDSVWPTLSLIVAVLIVLGATCVSWRIRRLRWLVPGLVGVFSFVQVLCYALLRMGRS
jgi:hypothetical protein